MSKSGGTEVQVIEREATLRDWVRLFRLFHVQAELDPFVGTITRLVALLLAVPLFVVIVLKGWRPRIVLVEVNGRLIGGFTLSRFGILENAALVNDPADGSSGSSSRWPSALRGACSKTSLTTAFGELMLGRTGSAPAPTFWSGRSAGSPSDRRRISPTM